MEMELPETPISADPRSYLLTDLKMEQLTFVSVKSEIRRNLRIAELEAEKEAKLNAKRKEFEKLKEEDAALDEETFFGRFGYIFCSYHFSPVVQGHSNITSA